MASRRVDHLAHRVGELAQRREQVVSVDAASPMPGGLGDGTGEQHAGGDLCVERLGRRDAHLDVAAVGGVQHAVGLVGEVAVAPVHDRRSRPRHATRSRSTVRLVSVVVPLWLTAIDERVAHVESQPEARQLGGGDGVDVECRLGQLVEHAAMLCPATAAVPWPITRTLRDRAGGEPGGDVGGQRALADIGVEADRHVRRSCRAGSCGSSAAPR